MKKFAYIIVFTLVASCTNTADGIEGGIKQDSSSLRAKVADLVYPEGKFLTPAVTTHQYSYCYKSWADVSCYKEPVAGQENLLIEGK
jgi:predicted small secreted protein